MKQFFSLALGVLAGLPLVAQETVLLETGFESGIPADFTLVCNDQMPVKSQNFRNISPTSEWFGGKVDSEDGKAAFSTSHRTYEMETDNWLITPKLTIPERGAWLKWTAKTIHYYLRDGYKVMISTTDKSLDSFTQLYSVEEETYTWNRHLVSLADYAGQDVYIAFVHNSQSKYLIALDHVYVGQPATADFVTKNETPRFAGNVGTVSVNGTFRNYGKDFNLAEVVCTSGTEVVDKKVWGENFLTGEESSFEFNLPVAVGEVSAYHVEAVSSEGERVTLVKDSVICSHFARTLFLEKATGTWCNSCPSVIPYIQNLEERYREEIVCVEAHINDPMSYLPYSNGFKSVVNLPTVLYNRDFNNHQYNVLDTKPLNKALQKATNAKVDLALEYDGNTTISVSSKVMFATDMDNTTDKYRIGYVLIEKHVPSTTEMRQSNGAPSMPMYNEYFYFPTGNVAPELMFFSNVPRGTESAFLGVKNSLPTAIKAQEEYLHETTLEIPETVVNKEEVAVIALVLNYYTDEVLNAMEVKLPSASSSVCWEDKSVDGEAKLLSPSEGTYQVVCPEDAPFTVSVLAADGSVQAVYGGTGQATVVLGEKLQSGFYLLHIQQGNRAWTRKVVW
ncbi:MAG: choice-of-anchor J domain-containing protein [Bacteroidaceae bacterium]|nr:choice-of-anchor J domain-containing protein [Bacteroidaceae bacterium]